MALQHCITNTPNADIAKLKKGLKQFDALTFSGGLKSFISSMFSLPSIFYFFFKTIVLKEIHQTMSHEWKVVSITSCWEYLDLIIFIIAHVVLEVNSYLSLWYFHYRFKNLHLKYQSFMDYKFFV